MTWKRLVLKRVADGTPTVSITDRGDVYLNGASIDLATDVFGASPVGERFCLLVNVDAGLVVIAPDRLGWTLSRRDKGGVLSNAMRRQVPSVDPGLYPFSIGYVMDERHSPVAEGRVMVFGFNVKGERSVDTLSDCLSDGRGGGDVGTVVVS